MTALAIIAAYLWYSKEIERVVVAIERASEAFVEATKIGGAFGPRR